MVLGTLVVVVGVIRECWQSMVFALVCFGHGGVGCGVGCVSLCSVVLSWYSWFLVVRVLCLRVLVLFVSECCMFCLLHSHFPGILALTPSPTLALN